MIKRNLAKLPWFIASLMLVGFLVYGFWPRAVEIEIVRTTRGSLEVTVDDDGETRIREKYTVAAPVSGKLMRLELHAGDPVVQDRTEIARFEPSDPSLLDARTRAEREARVHAAEASTQQAAEVSKFAQEALELAQHEYDRAQTLVQKSAISRAEFESAEHKQRMAQSEARSAQFAKTVAVFEYEQAKAALSLASENGQSLPNAAFRVLAPIDGQVLKILHEDTSVVSAGTALLQLGDPDDMELVVDVLSNDAVRIRAGQKVKIKHWGRTEPLSGIVRLVEPMAFLKVSALGVEEKRVNVLIDFTDASERREALGDGFRVEVSIVVAVTSDDALLVPAGVLFREGSQWQLFRVVDDRAVYRRKGWDVERAANGNSKRPIG